MAGRIDPAEARTPREFVVLLRRSAAQAHNGQADRLLSLVDGTHGSMVRRSGRRYTSAERIPARCDP